MKRKYVIDYCCATTVGMVRKNNEDNFYCDGNIRVNPDSTDDEFFSGSTTSRNNDMFAVFDGMGGEACGEIASFAAAQNSQVFLKDRLNYNEYLYELSEMLNDSIRTETKARSLVLMGTTAAMIQFSPEEVYVLNAGDSRIYKISKHKICRVSTDHTAPGYGSKAPLTKFLGMPGEDTPLNPYIAHGSYKSGDVYVLCTDGITDMITEDQLLVMTDSKKPLDEITDNIINTVKKAGAVDNATIIICRVSVGNARR